MRMVVVIGRWYISFPCPPPFDESSGTASSVARTTAATVANKL
jgi:hypothetical protein